MKQVGIDLELDEITAQGVYSNLAIISHFAVMLPGVPKAKVKSRVILTPEHAKRLLMSLQDNITRYESNMGQIKFRQPDMPNGGYNKIGEA